MSASVHTYVPCVESLAVSWPASTAHAGATGIQAADDLVKVPAPRPSVYSDVPVNRYRDEGVVSPLAVFQRKECVGREPSW